MANKKTVVATYASPIEAEIARTRLEDAEIWCAIHDAGIVSADPLLGIAVGGVRVMVFDQDLRRAAEILADERDGTLESEDDGLDDEPAVPALGLSCPACGSDDVGFSTGVHVYWSVFLLVAILPVFVPHEPQWGWVRTAHLPVATTLLFVGIWATILRLAPLKCRECGESGRRAKFQRPTSV